MTENDSTAGFKPSAASNAALEYVDLCEAESDLWSSESSITLLGICIVAVGANPSNPGGARKDVYSGVC
ncbi:hypothetical protein J7T55_008467 [Diaporthe amygdali]|uniref:uncharacterized protein n=1 Tax=Phomopsis amygdali TaxID=1214568 RepID=UPI0022FE8345|nr:uncharacterized protein J7T55_008467 [Diaporthe amygdali]KAJ0121304.1 hypothetical protein J7T55_008467 [Diaporthe amygdali]